MHKLTNYTSADNASFPAGENILISEEAINKRDIWFTS